MAKLEKLIREYLIDGKTQMMQLATSRGDQPWVCTVYYAADEELNLYWLSLEDTRHSKELIINPRVAGTVVFSQEPYPKEGIRGLQFEGIASVLSGDEEEKACEVYVPQLKREHTLLEDIRSGKNPHKLYKITPTKFVLFDKKNFPDNPRQEWQVN